MLKVVLGDADGVAGWEDGHETHEVRKVLLVSRYEAQRPIAVRHLQQHLREKEEEDMMR